MEISGEIENIIYKNESNGYTVAAIYSDSDGEEIVATGYLPFVNKGDNVKLKGSFVVHPEYGEQFKIQSFEKIIPQTEDALIKHLANGTIKGVGPATAKRIVDRFGKDTIIIMKTEPERLAEIKGISYEKAMQISEDFIENWELWQIVSFLEKFGIGSENAQKIYKNLGADTINKIEADPYILEEIGIKVNFAQIDKMALSIGIERNSLRRIESGIIHALNLASYNGHTCVLEPNLITFVVTLLGITDEDVIDGIKNLRSKEKIYTEKREEMVTKNDKTEMMVQTWVYRDYFYNSELNIANRILGLQNADNMNHIKNIENRIKKISEITPSEKQNEAIKMVNDNNVTIITGGPGTGKTTIIKTIIELYKSIGKKAVLCAPTGRAAKRMTEATGEEAKTLHRLLEIRKGEEIPEPDLRVAPIDADIVIIDEMSMVDVFLMNYLLNALYKGTKLVLVGDVDQLQSVGPGRVLKDLIQSEKVPYIALNKIFRQAAKSKIIVNSHKVNEGIDFLQEVNNEHEDTLDDFNFISELNLKNAQEIVVDMFDYNTQIITPTKKGELGTYSLNKVIQDRYNPQTKKKNEKKFGTVIFREGDKVMQTKNNYDIEWVKEHKHGLDEHGTGIFNGEMGIIEEIDSFNSQIKIQFEDLKTAIYEYSDLEQIEHCFAITVHKSQGSEFDSVIMPILSAAQMLLTRNVLYTGMTRAKNKLTIVGSPNVVEYMINNVNSKKRNSGLEYKLRNI